MGAKKQETEDQEESFVDTSKVVSTEVATKEVTKWLDFHRIKSSERQTNKPFVDFLINAVEDGNIIIHEDFTITQKLMFPIKKEDEEIEKFKYKNRPIVATIHSHMKSVADGDDSGRLAAHIAAFTSRTLELVRKAHPSDYKIGRAIIIFFV